MGLFRFGKPPKAKRTSSQEGLWVELDDKSDARWNLIGEWGDRAEKLAAMAPYVAAMETYQGLMQTIPAGRRYGSYRKILRAVRVGPKGWKGGVFAVYGKPKASRDEMIDAARTVVYVRVKANRATPPRPETKILEKYSPWTMETLPFSPRKSDALVVTRLVSRREVKSVTDKRKADEKEWSAALTKTGVRFTRNTGVPTELKNRTVQDVAFDALRLEFGYGGTKPLPHWRPSIREAVQVVRQLWRTKSRLSDPMVKPKTTAWKKWPPQTGSIRIADLKNLVKFQKRLRIRV